jgi:hypothetical protein
MQTKETLQQAVTEDQDYIKLLAQMREIALRSTVVEQKILFTTDAAKLWDKYISNMPAQEAAVLNCSSCRSFIKRYGSLVTVDENGKLTSVMWPESLDAGRYTQAVTAMRETVQKATVTGVFLSLSEDVGIAEREGWKHFSAALPASVLNTDLTKTINAKVAERQQALRTFARFALSSSTRTRDLIQTAELATHLFKVGTLQNADRFQANAEWVRDSLCKLRDTLNSKDRRNLMWKLVCEAPIGWSSPNTSVSTLLLDLIIKNQTLAVNIFNDKTNPTKHMIATTAPTQGAVKVAENKIEAMGLGSSLPRRNAGFDEIPKEYLYWTPKVKETVEDESKSVFGNIKTKDEVEKPKHSIIEGGIISWHKFNRVYLETADKIELRLVGLVPGHQLTLPLNENNKPLFVWDSEEDRNPFSWVTHNRKTPPNIWSLEPGAKVEILGISFSPTTWSKGVYSEVKAAAFGERARFGLPDQAFLFMKDAVINTKETTVGLFPSVLRKELYDIRSVISAYSETNRLNIDASKTGAAAAAITANNTGFPLELFVHTGDFVTHVTVDRWE